MLSLRSLCCCLKASVFLYMEAGNLVPGVVEGAAFGNWADMPTDVLREIAGRIQGMEDYVRFASVCKSWYSPLRWECPKSSKPLSGYPWLMLVEEERGAEEEQGECVRKKRGFYGLYSGKQFNLDLPESCGRTCFGSSCGWLLTMGLDLEMHLLNPITREQLPLPSQTTFPHQFAPQFSAPEFLRRVFIHKVFVIYDDPVAAAGDRRTPIVFVIYSQFRLLAMARPGDSSWTPILHPSLDRAFFDVSSFRDQVIVYQRWKIMICHFFESPPRFEDVCVPPPQGYDCNVVDLGGELYTLCSDWKISLRYGKCSVKRRFRAYKLDFVKKTWEEVDTLGGWAVFVGRNSSFALPSSYYPQCRPNCIYFTDDRSDNFRTCGGCDWGIYDYGNRCKENEGFGEETPRGIISNPFPISHNQFSTYSPLLWMVPSLW